MLPYDCNFRLFCAKSVGKNRDKTSWTVYCQNQEGSRRQWVKLKRNESKGQNVQDQHEELNNINTIPQPVDDDQAYWERDWPLHGKKPRNRKDRRWKHAQACLSNLRSLRNRLKTGHFLPKELRAFSPRYPPNKQKIEGYLKFMTPTKYYHINVDFFPKQTSPSNLYHGSFGGHCPYFETTP